MKRYRQAGGWIDSVFVGFIHVYCVVIAPHLISCTPIHRSHTSLHIVLHTGTDTVPHTCLCYPCTKLPQTASHLSLQFHCLANCLAWCSLKHFWGTVPNTNCMNFRFKWTSGVWLSVSRPHRDTNYQCIISYITHYTRICTPTRHTTYYAYIQYLTHAHLHLHTPTPMLCTHTQSYIIHTFLH